MFPNALRLVLEQGQAHSGMLFVLDLKTGYFELDAALPPSSDPNYSPVWFGNQLTVTLDPTASVESNEPLSPLVRCAIRKASVLKGDPDSDCDWESLGVVSSDSALLAPMVRADTCLGMVLLLRDRSFTDREVRALSASVQTMTSIYDVRTQYRLLGEMQAPLDLGQANDEFFAAVIKLLAKSSGMEFIALRRLEPDGSLTTIKVEKIDADNATILPESVIAGPFMEAVSTQQAVSIDSVASEGLEQAVQEFAPEVRSFVVAPILLGRSREFYADTPMPLDQPRGRVFGTLSLASRVEYEFSLLERIGFMSLANGIGLAIENYANVLAVSVLREKQIEAGAALQAQEMAQGFRHEIRKKVDNIVGVFATDLSPAEIKAHVHRQTAAIVSVLDEWKNYPGGALYHWDWHPLRSLWNEALDLAEFQLDEARVDVRERDSIPMGLELYCSKDHFIRFVLDGLILNSIDAFRERPSRTPRELRLVFAGESSAGWMLRYRDSAGGIRPDQIRSVQRRRSDWAELPTRQVLFEAGFTTKAAAAGGAGGGYGLYLARNTMAQHDSEIELVDAGEPGAVFELRLPRHHVRGRP